MTRLRLSSLLLASAFAASCAAALAASLDGCALPGFSLAPPEAGPDVHVVEAGPPPCGLTYPDPPGATDSNSLPPIVVAIHTVDLGDMADTPGYDLDSTCTCYQDAGNSCVGPSPNKTTYCDADGGVDNQAAKLFQLIELPLGAGNFGSTFFSEKANDGNWSLLIQISNYNGQPDDPAVDVAFFPTKGLGMTPMWNGNDAWPVDSTAVGDGGPGTSIYNSNGAYVSGGILVATFPTNRITLAGGTETISVQLSAGVLTARLSKANGMYSLTEGVIAARWSGTDIFRSLSSFRDNNGNPICTNMTTYTVAKGVICNDLDISVDGTQPKSAPCNALSIGIGFTADPAALGIVADAGGRTDGCAPNADPANDSCP